MATRRPKENPNIMSAILTALARYRQDPEPEDDVTLVVIKIVED